MRDRYLHTDTILPTEFEFPQWEWGWDDNGYPKLIVKSEWTTFTNDNKNKEEEMTPTKKYLFNKKSAKEKHAVELGVLDEDGLLTEDGKDFLLNLLLEDEHIKNIFYNALHSIKEEDE